MTISDQRVSELQILCRKLLIENVHVLGEAMCKTTPELSMSLSAGIVATEMISTGALALEYVLGMKKERIPKGNDEVMDCVAAFVQEHWPGAVDGVHEVADGLPQPVAGNSAPGASDGAVPSQN